MTISEIVVDVCNIQQFKTLLKRADFSYTMSGKA